VIFLSLDDILESHQNQIDTYGGGQGIRDIGLLESAIAQPEACFGGQFLHADVFEMAAAYLYHLVMNHPFVDGNKRVGLEAALIFL
jgi:death on curing protein